MSYFLVPLVLLVGSVLLGFLLCCYFVRYWYFVPLMRRIKRLEYLAEPPRRNTTENVVTVNTPRPTRPSHYITVDRTPKPEYYR